MGLTTLLCLSMNLFTCGMIQTGMRYQVGEEVGANPGAKITFV